MYSEKAFYVIYDLMSRAHLHAHFQKTNLGQLETQYIQQISFLRFIMQVYIENQGKVQFYLGDAIIN